MKRVSLSIFLVILLSNVSLAKAPEGEKILSKSFPAVERLKIKLVLGDCLLKTSTSGKIDINLKYSYPDEFFEPYFNESSKSLTIQEKFLDNNPGGHAFWEISIPKGKEVKFESATGDLEISTTDVEIDGNTGTGDIIMNKAAGQFDLNTGTGKIVVKDCQGEFDLNSGTGKVKIENTSGEFKANSGTGDVSVANISITDEADFNSGTGDVEVLRPKGNDFDLTLNSGTNNATLDMGGLPVEGYFEFSANAHGGDIRSPYDFDEEKFSPRGDHDTVVKSFRKGKNTPRYYIGTGTGTAELKK